MKCQKCNLVSHDHNLQCPGCGKDLARERAALGITYMPPEQNFDNWFLDQDPPTPLPIDTVQVTGETNPPAYDDNFEFSLD